MLQFLTLLQMIGKQTYPELLWVCRDSTMGRGLRLHQASDYEIAGLGCKGYTQPWRAIKEFAKEQGDGLTR